MRSNKRDNTPGSSNPATKKPKLSKAAQKILERKKKNEQMLKQMESRIKGRVTNNKLITRNYDQFSSSNKKARSENHTSNKVRYSNKYSTKGSNFGLPQRPNHVKDLSYGYASHKPTDEYIKYSNNTSYSKDCKNLTVSTMSKGDSKQAVSHKTTFNYHTDVADVRKWRKKAPHQSLNMHHSKMNGSKNGAAQKGKMTKQYESTKPINKKKLDMESEREAVVFCKRGQRKKQLLEQHSPMSQGKQSLIEAKEPSPEVISRASYLKSQGKYSDAHEFSNSKNNEYKIPEIVNLRTSNKACFSKKFSNAKSTFLNEEEEEDMQNVNEFSDAEEYIVNRQVNKGNILNHERVLKTLPITKESFMNWQKHSMLKSFATSQEASFVSNRPTERIDSTRVNIENINPREVLNYEQQCVKMEILNEPKKQNLREYSNKKYYESPEQVSTVFMDESSAFFEEYAAMSSEREASATSNVYSYKQNHNKPRDQNLHNWAKLHNYDFIKAHKPKDSIVISRSRGDTDLVFKESMEYIECPDEHENYESSSEESKSIPVQYSLFEDTDRKLSIHQTQLRNITEEKESQIVSTPGYDDIEKEVHDTPKVKNKSLSRTKIQDNSESHKLNNLVTKVDPFPTFSKKQKPVEKSSYEPVYDEQGQNSGDEDFYNNTMLIKNSENVSEERTLDRYLQKDSSPTVLTVTKSEQSHILSTYSNESPRVDTHETEDEHQSELHKAHLIQTLQAIQYIKSLQNDHSLEGKYVNLPPHPAFETPETTKTIIFDLDETLVHCVDEPEQDNPHVILKITFPTGETVDAGINVRPYAIECLKEATKYFQVVVFTASHQSYADVVLDYIDPNHELIQYRLYRESWIQTKEGVYIKDLRIVQNRSMENICIVDNAVYSFGFQLDNGIPIIPFYDDPNDEELHHLVFYMKCLSQLGDMRIQNQNAFQLSALDSNFIEKYLEEYYSKIKDEMGEEAIMESPALQWSEEYESQSDH